MAINKLVAGSKGDVNNSTGAQIAQSVNDLIDESVLLNDTTNLLKDNVNELIDGSGRSLLSHQKNLTVFGNSISESLNNFGTWFCRKSDGNVIFYKNAGVGGNTTPLMLARLADVPDETDVVSVMEATNDAASAITPTQHAQNIKTILEHFMSRGVQPIMLMAPPHDDPARSQLVDKMNLYDYVTAKNLGVGCYDIWSQICDPIDGSWTSGASSDGTHPDPATEKTAGYLLNDKYLNSKHHIPLPRNNQLTDATMPNTNPCFIDSTGNRPTRWATNGSQNTETLSVTSLGLGNTWHTNWVNSAVFLNSSRFDVTAGDEWLFVMRFESTFNSGTAPLSAYLEYDVTIDGVSRVYFFREASVDVDACTLSAQFVVPTGVSTIRFCVNTLASGTYDLDVKIAQAQMYNLSQYSV